jgi:hypothetical protein
LAKMSVILIAIGISMAWSDSPPKSSKDITKVFESF